MTSASENRRGACLCGAVGFSADLKALEVGTCHCSMCRKWSGGVFMAVECNSVEFDADAPFGVYRSSEWGERCFCTKCGSSLLWRSVDGAHFAVSLQAFEKPEEFKFVSQIFIDEKPANYSFSEATQNMTGPEFIAMVTSAEHQNDRA